MEHPTAVHKPEATTVDTQLDLAVLTLYGLPASVLFLGAVLGSFLGRIIVGGPVFWSALIGCSLYALVFWAIRRATTGSD